jgi:DNA-binding XRE family transcriptional regulator
MDCQKTGQLIRRLRLEQNMTQQQLADKLSISPKTVSKWECGSGCPDVSLLGQLALVLGVQAETLLQGGLNGGDPVSGNMKKTNFYVCPLCGSVTASTGAVQLSCCGKVLSPLSAQKAGPEEKLKLDQVEDEWFITSDHPMTKECYISFLAFARGDSLQIYKQYPEWDLQLRLPRRGHGTLFWYSTKKGLFYQYI